MGFGSDISNRLAKDLGEILLSFIMVCILLSMLLYAFYHTSGGADQQCNHDGSCDGQYLVCRKVENTHRCVLREEK